MRGGPKTHPVFRTVALGDGRWRLDRWDREGRRWIWVESFASRAAAFQWLEDERVGVRVRSVSVDPGVGVRTS